MTGERKTFSELNTKIQGTVCFGDGSVTNIASVQERRPQGTGQGLAYPGRGSSAVNVSRWHVGLVSRVSDDYTMQSTAEDLLHLIPRLTVNIVSLSQFEEDGCRILLFTGCLKVSAVSCSRIRNMLYVLKLNVIQPVCLAAQRSSAVWRWHVRFGHLNFHGLWRLAKGGLVDGLPQLDHVDQVCDSCLTKKQ